LFLLSFIPGAFIGTVIWLQLISLTEWQPIIKMILAVYIILFILFSHTIRITPSNAKRSMLASGALAGIGSMTVGAVAPVMAPFFIALKLNKNEFSGTWAVASFIASASKIPLFILIWDRVEISHGGLIFLLFAGTFIGAYLGKMLFDRTSEQFFRRAMYAFLIIAACKLFVWDGAKPLIADRTNVFNFNTASGKTIQVPN